MGRVIKAQPDQDGLVRKVILDVGSPSLSLDGKRNQPLSTLERPIHRLVLLMSEDQRRAGNPRRGANEKCY